MEEFQIKYFAENLKNIAKNDFGGVGKLAELVGLQNLSPYTKQKNPIEPSAKFFFKLAKLNVDINKLLTGNSFMDKEVSIRLELIEKEIIQVKDSHKAEINAIKAKLFDVLEENANLKEKAEKLEAEKEVLLSRVSAFNQTVSTKTLKGT